MRFLKVLKEFLDFIYAKTDNTTTTTITCPRRSERVDNSPATLRKKTLGKDRRLTLNTKEEPTQKRPRSQCCVLGYDLPRRDSRLGYGFDPSHEQWVRAGVLLR
jgi:hypothetical protein